VCHAANSEGGFVFRSEAGEPKRALPAGDRGLRLVSATTTNAAGSYVTGIYWDTTPAR